jgi:hypothetical protein
MKLKSSVIKAMTGPIAQKWHHAIRLLALLHKQPRAWIQYKELFLPERVQTERTKSLGEAWERLKLLSMISE